MTESSDVRSADDESLTFRIVYSARLAELVKIFPTECLPAPEAVKLLQDCSLTKMDAQRVLRSMLNCGLLVVGKKLYLVPERAS